MFETCIIQQRNTFVSALHLCEDGAGHTAGISIIILYYVMISYNKPSTNFGLLGEISLLKNVSILLGKCK
jgi:hypothetical protein